MKKVEDRLFCSFCGYITKQVLTDKSWVCRCGMTHPNNQIKK